MVDFFSFLNELKNLKKNNLIAVTSSKIEKSTNAGLDFDQPDNMILQFLNFESRRRGLCHS